MEYEAVTMALDVWPAIEPVVPLLTGVKAQAYGLVILLACLLQTFVIGLVAPEG
jgi:hypothetical protein